MSCHFLLQGIFPTQGSNLGLPHCRQTLYHLSHQGSHKATHYKTPCPEGIFIPLISCLHTTCSLTVSSLEKMWPHRMWWWIQGQGSWNYQSTMLLRAGDLRGLYFMATTHTIYLFVNFNTKKTKSGKCSLQLLPYREESKAK